MNLCFDLFLAVLKVLLYLEVTIQRQRFILAFVSCVEEIEHITTNIRWFCFVKCQRRYDETLAWIYQRFTTRESFFDGWTMELIDNTSSNPSKDAGLSVCLLTIQQMSDQTH